MFNKILYPGSDRLASMAKTLRGIHRCNPGMFRCDRATLLNLATELEIASSYGRGWNDAIATYLGPMPESENPEVPRPSWGIPL